MNKNVQFKRTVERDGPYSISTMTIRDASLQKHLRTFLFYEIRVMVFIQFSFNGINWDLRMSKSEISIEDMDAHPQYVTVCTVLTICTHT